MKDKENEILLSAKFALAIIHDLQEEIKDIEDKLTRLIFTYQKKLLKKVQEEVKE